MGDPFVTTGWLAEHLGDPGFAIVDASWYLPAQNRDARAEYLAGHIPGAVFFDIDAIADTASALPHMLPSPAEFARMVGALGIGDGMTIVVYDEMGLQSAPRVHWTFELMGAENVRILEGGGARWRAENRPVEAGEVWPEPKTFTPRFDGAELAGLAAVRAALSGGQIQVVDARPAARFNGDAPEPRAHLRGGHMPGALNVPYAEVVRDGALRPVAELRSLFADAAVDTAKPIITSCGSGITAAIVALALKRAGATDVAVYDGSWAEWGGRDDTEVVSG